MIRAAAAQRENQHHKALSFDRESRYSHLSVHSSNVVSGSRKSSSVLPDGHVFPSHLSSNIFYIQQEEQLLHFSFKKERAQF